MQLCVDKTIKIWNIDDGKELQILNSIGFSNVVFAPNSKYLASAGSDNTIKIWNIDGKELQTLKGHNSPVLSTVFSPDGNQLASASADNTVKSGALTGKNCRLSNMMAF